jgi:hypothetical protein
MIVLSLGDKTMEEKRGSAKKKVKSTLWVVLAVILCGITVMAALSEDQILGDTSFDSSNPVAWGNLWVYGQKPHPEPEDPDPADVYVIGKAELLPGARIGWFIYARAGGVVAVRGGKVGLWMDIAPGAEVTIYGDHFIIGSVPSDPGTYDGFFKRIIWTREDGQGTSSIIVDCRAKGAAITLAPSGGAPIINLDVDIKPDSEDNTIKLGSLGVVPVAILSTDDFAATDINPDTVELAGAGVAVRGKGGKLLAGKEDVNGDGKIDLVVKIETKKLDPNQFEDGSAVLTAETYNGQACQGADSVTVVPE